MTNKMLIINPVERKPMTAFNGALDLVAVGDAETVTTEIETPTVLVLAASVPAAPVVTNTVVSPPAP
jgi:hypothetical protein